MSAFTSIYTSLTGLRSFSTGLNVISDNVANLNTPGFKANEILFDDLGPRDPFSGPTPGSFDSTVVGSGVRASGTTRNFGQGDFESTGNATDMAVDGNGMFVLSQNGEQFFTRAAQFTFDGSGFLLNPAKAHVQAIDASGKLVDFQIDPHMTKPPVATTQVAVQGNLSTGTTPQTFNGITLIDANGTSVALKLNFEKQDATTGGEVVWKVAVTDSEGKDLGSGTLRYGSGGGTPVSGSDHIDVTLATAGSASPIPLDFSGTTSFSSSSSTLAQGSSDGVALGALTQVTIDSAGIAQLAFSNGTTDTGPQLALARFSTPQSLVDVGSALFQWPDTAARRGDEFSLGRATEGSFGSIQAGKVELANVDLSQEFAKIIVLQRAFQGSSEVLNISSQLLEQLYTNIGGR